MENCYWPHDAPPWLLSPAAAADDRAASASRSHSEAEKRRRDRINAQLSTLRKLIPKSEKMDKAALLGHVVDHVKEQRQRAKEASKSSSSMPSEIDEVIIDQHHESEHIKASICCDDRPELFAELKAALKPLEATILEAEVTSLGGRIKANFIISAAMANQHTLKMALTRLLISSGSGSSGYGTRSKRQRFFYPTSR
ncbi:transcription factor bHLH51 [Salvia miltiorrhiza]|uniref:Basic helix-loop-helix transcription factor n=1 Tax=Salvia miltiorrhiza TaxID=226208 RepID=A0A0H3Y7K3_SALMI|nr:transcription factor bHLH51 [Salvia miltiorrhiza]AKN09603.1 basic helix-loop-helix transcription factor [Salvia miltiorrhiza]